jgi:Peptidase S46
MSSPGTAPNGGAPCSQALPSRYHERFAAPGGKQIQVVFPMKLVPLAALAALVALPAAADEGMWTFDNPPREAMRQKYGVTLDSAWLDRVRGATVRLETGCTGSFISGDGLILTNHHCALDCIAQNSSEGNDLVAQGFLAGTREKEVKCEEDAVSVLMATEDVTAKVAAALEGVAADKIVEARRAALTKLEQACEEESAKAKGGPLKCEQVALYQGGQHWLYKYKRFEDVRLAFAPEYDVAQFGGDPDNFQFPRWCLDMSLLRAYENGKPARTPNHLRFDWDGAQPGDAVFVSGHPGDTSRLLTTAQLELERETYLPFWLLRYSELRGRMIQYSKTGEEPRRTAEAYLQTIENAIKVRRKQLDALLDPALLENAAAKEKALQDAVAADPTLASSANAWADIEKAQASWRNILVPHTFLEGAAAFNGNLFGYARTLVRAAAERAKPNETRLPEYTEARLPAVVQGLKADAPIYPDFEILRLSFGVERMREWLGPDDPVVKSVFGKDSPDALATRLVRQTKLADPGTRMALYEGGQASIDASQDPLIRLAAAVDPASRALRKESEETVDGPTERAQEAIAKARFAEYGTSIYPDATFTLRLSYGAVKGWTEKGTEVRPWTELSRAFERATGEPPFRIPPRWVAAKDRLDLSTRVNFTTDNDVVGGNSGSPMLSAAGEIVGLAFDGNIHSISGSYWFDERTNRTIGVHPAYIRTALEQVYDAKALLTEIDGR